MDRNVMEDVTLTCCYIKAKYSRQTKQQSSATNHQGPTYQAWRWWNNNNNNRTGGHGCFTFSFLHSLHSHKHLPLPNNLCHSQHGYLGQGETVDQPHFDFSLVFVRIWIRMKTPITRLMLGTCLQFSCFHPISHVECFVYRDNITYIWVTTEEYFWINLKTRFLYNKILFRVNMNLPMTIPENLYISISLSCLLLCIYTAYIHFPFHVICPNSFYLYFNILWSSYQSVFHSTVLTSYNTIHIIYIVLNH